MVIASACGSFGGDDALVAALEGGGGTDGPTPTDSAPLDAPSPNDGGAEAGFRWTVLATGFTDLAGVAATETSVYFTERTRGIVHEMAIGGGTVSEVQNTMGSPASIVVTSSDVFWGEFGGNKLSRRGLTGGAVTTVTRTSGKAPLAMATASDRIVVVALDSSSNGEIQQYQFDFASGPSVGNLTNPFDVAVQAEAIFWTESSLGRIFMGTVGTTNASPIVQNESDCQSIAADALGIYWTRPSLDVGPSAGLVRMSSPSGANVRSLATGQRVPMSLASDPTGVYWLTLDGTLRRSTRSEPIETLAGGFNAAFKDFHIQAIALTSKYVVWITNDGQVLRLAK